MKLAVSTSGPNVFVAVLKEGRVQEVSRPSDRNATAVLASILTELQVDLDRVTEFHLDIGPGSFTGVRVGVTMVKVWAHLAGKEVVCHTAFDLVDPNAPVSIPSRKGEAFHRSPGEQPTIVKTDQPPPPAPIKIGTAFALPGQRVRAEAVAPLYVAQPSISQAKRPQIMGETFA